MQHAICDMAKKYRFAIRHIKNNRDLYTDAQHDIVYRNIAATHIAYDTEGMLHGEISHGNFIIFDAFLGLFWFFSTSERVIICDYKHLESLITLIKIVNEVQKKMRGSVRRN